MEEGMCSSRWPMAKIPSPRRVEKSKGDRTRRDRYCGHEGYEVKVHGGWSMHSASLVRLSLSAPLAWLYPPAMLDGLERFAPGCEALSRIRSPFTTTSSCAASRTMSASQGDSSSLLARLHPSHYLSTHLAHDSRPSSSRKPLDFPDVDFNLGPIASSSSSSNRPAWLPSPSALARHGSTTVVCNITPNIVYPPPTASTSVASSAQSGSTLVPSINLTPLSSPSADFKSGAPSNFAQFTTERLFEFLASSLPFDPRVLDIPMAAEGGEEGKDGEEGPTRAKWCLFADCTVVGYDGGLLETALLAITAALRQRE